MYRHFLYGISRELDNFLAKYYPNPRFNPSDTVNYRNKTYQIDTIKKSEWGHMYSFLGADENTNEEYNRHTAFCYFFDKEATLLKGESK